MVQSVGLGIQVPDLGRSLAQGMQLRAASEQMEGQNALRAMLAQPGVTQGLLAGDPNILAQIAGIGPQGLNVALPVMNQVAERGMQRERLDMQREQMAQELALGRARLAQAARMENADPAAVREWQFFSGLSPEEQSRYLLMKRAQPFLNTGTEFTRPDPVTGQPGATVQQNIRGRESEEVLGRVEGERVAAAPEAVRTATETMRLIDGTLNHPALRMATGALSFTSAIPGTPMFDFGQRVAQLQGRAFLEAFESLKGGGQITEREGQAATAAMARLSQAQTTEAFRESLAELRGIAQAARERAARRLPAQDPAPMPGPGGVGIAEPPPRAATAAPAATRPGAPADPLGILR